MRANLLAHPPHCRQKRQPRADVVFFKHLPTPGGPNVSYSSGSSGLPMPGNCGPGSASYSWCIRQGVDQPMASPAHTAPRAGRAGDTQAQQSASFEDLKTLIHGKLVDKLDLSRLGDLEGDTLRREIRLVVEHLCDTENPLLNRSERERLIEEVLDETFGFGPLEILLKDPTISDIMINGPNNVFVDKRARIVRSAVVFRNNAHLLQIIDRIVSKVGRRIDETSPMVDARLPDGSRLNAVIPPLAIDGPSISIRRFGANPLSLEDLLKFGAFTPQMVMLLEGPIKARLNIIVSGGTGSGKTTLLNTLSSFIHHDPPIIPIEHPPPLHAPHAP